MRNSVPSSHSTPSRRDRAKQNRDKWEVSGAKAVQMAERSAAESKRLSERLEKALSGERQKFHEVNQELEKIKKEMAQIEQRLHDEKVARVHSEQELETLKIEMQRKDDRLMQTQAQLHCLEEEYKDLQQQTKESRIALEECSKQLVDEKTNKATACREVERLAGKVNYLEDKIQKDEDDYHRQHAIAVDTLQKELDGIKVGAKRELEKLKDELRKTKADAYSKISSLEEQKSALQAQLVEQCSAGGESDHSSMSKDAPSVASTRKVSSPISETKCLKTV
ncbi:merozoite surface protein, putative [Perkinsus marinus ATCC 50983]|uniref:Merozoite surface protein, putative n=1 Tax=Perkinsus marinus (strain ATCC 50983 / TXsc) TaxID=423536 RepID=C5KRT5_PERM5|nr:merozoite surface protein, putative [Perkinsus marinus ATCC 50983]EER12776.1 merozoite surface protein, putative [Perkinsus marinus ATCC 50983]|eukprot:XP_002780981.1 merozoite surface protein, putative [Perkinsus marinus ATCC 50983]